MRLKGQTGQPSPGQPSRKWAGLLEDGDRLLRDNRGATMVMGVFIAVLLVGMIYYVWGIGDVIMNRERMQDASDTAAFSAAVIHARGMNILSLLNTVMAALIFVAATMEVISKMIMYAAIAASLVCLGCGPWCAYCCDACGDAATHWADYADAKDRSDTVNDIVDGMLQGIHAYAVAIRYGAPLAAQAKVIQYGEIYGPVTEFGFMMPIVPELPVVDDDTTWACEEYIHTPVRIAASAGALLFTSVTEFLAAGILAGQLDVAPVTNDWCEEGYLQRMDDDAQDMGNEEFQVQAYMFGDHDREWTQEGVAIATWGEGDDAGSTFDSIAETGRVNFAQAEFMYDDNEDDWHEWLWHMNWRARLRRWRLSGAGMGGLGEAAGVLGPLGSGIEDLVVH